MIKNISRMQAYGLIISVYFCIGFIDFIIKGRRLLNYTNLFSPDDYGENDKIILNYSIIKNILCHIALFAVSIENLKNLKYIPLSKDISSFYYLKEYK